MKVVKLILVMTLGVFFASCSSDDDSNNEDPITEPFFVKINGTDFVPAQATALLLNSSIVNLDNTINIEALDAQGKDIIIGFPADVEAGDTLNAGVFGTNGTNIFVPIYDTDTGGFFATSGTLRIVSHNTTTFEISGRFSFSAPDPDNPTSTINFTQGEFMLIYVPL